MTLGEIYARVCFLMWGNSNVPEASATALRGSVGMIQNVHRRIQKRADFWFMYKSAIIVATPFVQAYDLPSDYKRFVRALWAIDGEEGFSSPLKVVSNEDAIRMWKAPIANEEYPGYIEVAGSSVVVYPEPNPSFPYEIGDVSYDATATRNLHLIYWGWEDDIPDDDTEFDAYTDNLTVHGAEVLIFMTVADLALALEENNKHMVYKQRAEEAFDELLIEHESRMRKQLYVAKQYPYGQDING